MTDKMKELIKMARDKKRQDDEQRNRLVKHIKGLLELAYYLPSPKSYYFYFRCPLCNAKIYTTGEENGDRYIAGVDYWKCSHCDYEYAEDV